MEDRKFLFLYLNTGGGHRSAANVVKDIFTRKYPDASVKLVNGFDRRNYIGRFLLENFYHSSQIWAPGAYSLIYRTNSTRGQQILSYIIRIHTEKYLKKVLLQEKPTDIVVFHFALIDAVIRVAKSINPEINVRTIVLDPFTPHDCWFYRKEAKLYVFSEKAKKIALKNGLKEDNIKIVPFILHEKYRIPFTEEQVLELKKKHNFNNNKKMVLLTGGAEGFPLIVKIAHELIRREVDYTVVAVCGRSKSTRKKLEILAKTTKVDLRIYGYVNFMDELVKCCDCAVIKAGPASMMEVLACKKPVILSHFIYGQELGNVDYCIENHLGEFRNKTKSICNSLDNMLTNSNYQKQLADNFNKVDLNLNCDVIADYLINKE